MEISFTGGRLPATGCHALLSRDASVLDLSLGMRELCRRFRPQAADPLSFKALVAERDHPRLLKHLEQVVSGQEPDGLDLEVVRTFGAPLKAHVFSIPAPGQAAVHTFLSLGGREAPALWTTPLPAASVPEGFLVLRAMGESDRLIVTYCDGPGRDLLGESDPLLERSVFQLFSPEECQVLVGHVREARTTGEPRRFSLRNRLGNRIELDLFVSGESVMVVMEGELSSPSTDPANEAAEGAARAMEKLIAEELRPGLRALQNLAVSLGNDAIRGGVADPSARSRRLEILEELSEQLLHAVDSGGHVRAMPGIPEPEPAVLHELVEGVRNVIEPALAPAVRTVSIHNQVDPETPIVSPYPLASLQQILIDLIGEASRVVACSTVECVIRGQDELPSRMTLTFEITARAKGVAKHAQAAGLERRPMVKACRRFLKALGANLEGEVADGRCRFYFELPFGKHASLKTA